MLDVPYTCEAGTSGTGQGCAETTAQTDETITRYADTFNVFIESDQIYQGTTYQVLYGGFQWGFTYTATDTPEPSTWAMFLLGFAGLAFVGHSRAVRLRGGARALSAGLASD